MNQNRFMAYQDLVALLVMAAKEQQEGLDEEAYEVKAFWTSAQLMKEQREHSYSRELCYYLEEKKGGSSEPRRNSGKIRERALRFFMETLPGGEVLLNHVTGVPYIPPVPVKDGDRPGQTWRHLILRACHDTLHGGHVRGRTLVAKAGEHGWWESMADQAKKWQDKCQLCAQYIRQASVVARLRSNHASRPLSKIMFDLVEMNPPSRHGEKFVLTVICTYSKYVWFRACADKSAKVVAYGLYVIILDAGVCPLQAQSDCGREVYNALMNELMALLGVATLTSTPYKPTSEGMIERPHRELRQSIVTGLQQLGKEYRDWPMFLPMAEYRLRQKPILGTEGLTPYAVLHGFFGRTPLHTVTTQKVTAVTCT